MKGAINMAEEMAKAMEQLEKAAPPPEDHLGQLQCVIKTIMANHTGGMYYPKFKTKR